MLCGDLNGKEIQNDGIYVYVLLIHLDNASQIVVLNLGQLESRKSTGNSSLNPSCFKLYMPLLYWSQYSSRLTDSKIIFPEMKFRTIVI